MNKEVLNALLLLLEDSDNKTYAAVSESLMQNPDVKRILPALWRLADDGLAVSRIELMMHQLHLEQIKLRLTEWKMKGAKDIIEGAWLIASYQDRDLTLSEITAQITELTKDLWLELNEEHSPAGKIAALNRVLFSKHHFHGDRENLQNPDNAFINQVLQTRKGNDIALSIIYMGIAQKFHIPVYGVPLPYNFIVAYVNEDEQADKDTLEEGILFYINPFNRGVIFNNEEISRFINEQQIPHRLAFFLPCSNLVTLQVLVSGLLAQFEHKGMNRNAEEMNSLLQILKE